MKKLFSNKVFAVVICVTVILLSSILSTRFHLKKQLDNASGAELSKIYHKIDSYASHFPGSVLIPLSGIKY